VVCRRELSQARVDQEGIIPTAAVKWKWGSFGGYRSRFQRQLVIMIL
jgi:hypothetical protein